MSTARAGSFYLRNALFNFREQFSNIANGLLGILLLPLFMFVLSKMWQYFNSHLGNFTFHEMLAYIGFTEVLFMTFLRSTVIQSAAGDFSLSLARPRPWLAMQFSSNIGRTLGTRLIMSFCVLLFLALFGVDPSLILSSMYRFMILLIPLSVLQSLYSLIFACAHVRWEYTRHMTLPLSKIFLVFGGVFAPLADFSEPARSIILLFPPADLFFQPAYFCIKGAFFQLSTVEWSLRIGSQIFFLSVLNLFFFSWAKRHHQSFGG